MAAIDSAKEEFRQYLEKSGVIDALTKGEAHLLSLSPSLCLCLCLSLTPIDLGV